MQLCKLHCSHINPSILSFWSGLFLHWNLPEPLFQIEVSVTNLHRMANNVDPDEMAYYEPSHQDLHCLQKHLSSAGLKGTRVPMQSRVLFFYAFSLFKNDLDKVSWNDIWHYLSHLRCRVTIFKHSKRTLVAWLKKQIQFTVCYCKLTTSLINDSSKFTSSDTQICWDFLLKNVSSFCSFAVQKLLTFFQQKISEYCILNLLKQLTKWLLTSSLS